MKQKLAEWLNVIYGFRKMLLMLIIFIIGVVFRVKDLINGTEMVDLFKTTAIAFMSANGVEHIVGAVKEYATNGRAPVDAGPADTDESNDNNEVTPVVPG